MTAIASVQRQARRRNVRVYGVLAVVLLAVAMVTLLVGDYVLGPDRVVVTLFGGGERVEQYVVTQVRLPRLLMALLCGAALALAGSLLQALLRNPLASPDLLGISGGASVAAVTAVLVLGLPSLAVTGFAFAGGLVVAGILLLAARHVRDGGYRLVLAGIGISFLCAAIVGYLIKRAQLNDAQSAMVWITGSLGATVWRDVLVVAVVLAIAVPLVVIASRMLPLIALGHDVASGLGVRPVVVRTAIVALAVLLAAAATAFIGPVAFIALAAPAIARGIIGRGAAALAASALVGAILLATADLVAQFAIPGLAVPVGVVTGVTGAPYLLWLLATSKGRRT